MKKRSRLKMISDIEAVGIVLVIRMRRAIFTEDSSS